MLSLSPPKVFVDGAINNTLVDKDLAFGKLCDSMEEAGVHQPNKLTVYEFNRKLDYYQAKARKNKK